MPEEFNLPINEPSLQGVSQPVLVTDPVAPAMEADDTPPMQKRMWFLYPLVALGTSAVSGGVNSALLGKVIAGFPGGDRVEAAATLGLTLSVSGITYLIAGPIGGILSDKTRTRFLGRRNLWVLIGAIAGAVALLALGRSPNVSVLIVLAAVSTMPLAVILSASIAVVPERVPLSRRGRISSLNGLMGLVGAGLGIGSAALAPTIYTGFVILAVQLVVFCAIFAFFTRDLPAPERPPVTDPLAVLKPRFPTPRTHPDFWLTFAARGLAFMAFGLATGLQLYALRDYFKVGDGTTEAASHVLPQITVFSTLALAIAAVIGGLLVDRFGRIKPFVISSSLLFIPGALVLALVPTLPGAFIGFTIVGLAFGSYISIDGVLLTRVIPDKANAGRDLGFLNVSGSVGSIVAPVLGGALVASTGYAFVFLLVIVAGALAAGAVLFIRTVR